MLGHTQQATKPKAKQLSIGTKVNLGLITGLVIVAGVGAVSALSILRLNTTRSERTRAFQAELASNQLLTNLVNAETGQRGYLLTGQDSYLDPYNQAMKEQNNLIHKLLSLTTIQADRQLIQEIDDLGDKKLAELNQTVTLRRTKGFAAAQSVVLTGAGQSYMDQIRQKIAALNDSEEATITNDTVRSNQIGLNSVLADMAGTLLSLIVVVSAMVIINRDLTARKKIEDALSESEARLKAIIDSMVEGLVVANKKGEFVLFNKAAEELLGAGMMQMDPNEWSKNYGTYLTDGVTPFPNEQLPLMQALSGKDTHDVEMYIRNKRLRKARYINVSGSPLHNASGALVGGIAVFNDVTVRHEAEEKLSTEKAKAEAMLGSIGDGVFAIDTKRRIILFNHAAEELTDHSAKEALGHPYTDVLNFYNEKDGRLVDSFIHEALAGKKAAMALNTALRRLDGSSIPVADSAAPIVDSNGKVQGAVVVFRDITHEKELDHLKDDFVSIASHELRTPMGAIRAFVSMILTGDYGPVNDNLVEPLNDIRNSTLRLVELVNDMLDAARIEAGRMRFDLAENDLGDMLHEVAAVLTPLAKEKGLELDYHTPDKIAVLADPNKVKQVLTNLVGNALKFTDKGGIHIGTVIDAGKVEITVTDTGMGISLEDQAKLFNKFQQVSSSQKGRPPGTGLGLYISREMIRKMGGELWIKHSQSGQGSVFAFTLLQAQTPAAQRVQEEVAREAMLHPDQK